MDEAEIAHEVCPDADGVVLSTYMKIAAQNYWPSNVTRDGLFGVFAR
jgi:hypothetical protein